jgi:hypothetical protein
VAVGQAQVGRRLIDRDVFGMALHGFIAKQIARETATSQNSDLLSAVLNNANVGAVTGSGSTLYKVADFLPDLSSAAAKTLVEGTNLQPSYVGAKSAVVQGFLKQVDTTGDPIFDLNPNADIETSGANEGYSGTTSKFPASATRIA